MQGTCCTAAAAAAAAAWSVAHPAGVEDGQRMAATDICDGNRRLAVDGMRRDATTYGLMGSPAKMGDGKAGLAW